MACIDDLTPDDAALLDAVLSRPALVARIAALTSKTAAPAPKRAKVVARGDTPKQRAAWLRLSPERQEYLVQWETWRARWKAARYAGGPDPGPEPFDTTSQEAVAQITRNAEYEARVVIFERMLAERWGGDIFAREKALKASAQIMPYQFASHAEHMAAVQAHMDKASAMALEAAVKRADDSIPSEMQRDV